MIDEGPRARRSMLSRLVPRSYKDKAEWVAEDPRILAGYGVLTDGFMGFKYCKEAVPESELEKLMGDRKGHLRPQPKSEQPSGYKRSMSILMSISSRSRKVKIEGGADPKPETTEPKGLAEPPPTIQSVIDAEDDKLSVYRRTKSFPYKALYSSEMDREVGVAAFVRSRTFVNHPDIKVQVNLVDDEEEEGPLSPRLSGFRCPPGNGTGSDWEAATLAANSRATTMFSEFAYRSRQGSFMERGGTSGSSHNEGSQDRKGSGSGSYRGLAHVPGGSEKGGDSKAVVGHVLEEEWERLYYGIENVPVQFHDRRVETTLPKVGGKRQWLYSLLRTSYFVIGILNQVGGRGWDGKAGWKGGAGWILILSMMLLLDCRCGSVW